MKSLKQIQTLSKIGRILSKIAFIGSIIAFCFCIAGILSMAFGNGETLKFGEVTIHGLIIEGGYNIKSISAALAGWSIVCAGEAVLAKFAELYFKHELCAGTPFTQNGANELQRLGILTISITLGCAVVAEIFREILAGIMNVTADAAIDMTFDNDGAVALGIMFIILSVVCRYGAEIMKKGAVTGNNAEQ